ncbi:MAG: 6-phosphogluconolactonase [Planctomycetes bacterium RBG_13_62_9]|nr:MAG: 6-phosphogluconolactonase [Planctomycetes bacterium RBG_13_62_9]
MPNVQVAGDSETLAGQAVHIFASAAHDAIGSRGRFHVAISGGHTPKRFFELLAALPEGKSLPWEKVHMFWVDERYVPPDSPDSNYKLAADTFLNRVAIPPENVHRIPTEHGDIRFAADSYETTIREVFGLQNREMPEFDLIILGMGVDGHTGSLFPNSYATFDVDDLACVVYVLDGTLNRVTLTPPVLLAARRLVVLVSGEEKAHTLREVLAGEPDEVKYPIHVLWPVLDKITWLVDRDAAGAL